MHVQPPSGLRRVRSMLLNVRTSKARTELFNWYYNKTPILLSIQTKENLLLSARAEDNPAVNNVTTKRSTSRRFSDPVLYIHTS